MINLRISKVSAALALALALGSGSATAAPISINLEKVELTAFLAAMYGGELKKNYVLSPALVGDSRKVSLHVQVERDNLASFIKDYLARMGIDASEKDGILYLMPAGQVVAQAAPVAFPSMPPLVPGMAAPEAVNVEPPAKNEFEVYEPMNRPAAFLATVANAVHPASAVVAGQRVVINAPRDTLDKIKSLFDKVDIEARRVAVNATFVEVSGSQSTSRGVSLVANVLGAQLGIAVGDTSGSSVSLKNANFEMVLNALNTDGRFKQVSTPRVIVDESEQVDQIVGNETPTITGTSLDKNGNPIQQTTYRPSGVIIQVTPTVLGSGKINLGVDAQVSSFQQTRNGVNSSPTLIKRQVKGKVTLNDGEVVVMGGLNENKSVSSSSAISFLPKSWSMNSGSSDNTDLVLILSASIAR